MTQPSRLNRESGGGGWDSNPRYPFGHAWDVIHRISLNLEEEGEICIFLSREHVGQRVLKRASTPPHPMAKPERQALIAQLEAARNSRVVCYVTATRQNLEVHMAMDAIFKMHEHLKRIAPNQKIPKIDLFLCSNGGDGTVPWRLVTLIREFCDEFNVLVPYRAFSAATLTALGADHVVMHRMGMLGPTDATVINAFNPRAPHNPSQQLGISVEDVSAYLALVKEDAGITHEDELVIAFNKLAEQVHPLALGNVKRHISQSRLMARKLLSLHLDTAAEGQRINEIVENLTSKSFYHSHPINRMEAKSQIGIEFVQNATQQEEDLMWQLYCEYDLQLQNERPFNFVEEYMAVHPTQLPGIVPTTQVATNRLVYIESTGLTHCSSFDYQISGTKLPNASVQCTLITLRQGWNIE